jgi:hypothetical protein
MEARSRGNAARVAGGPMPCANTTPARFDHGAHTPRPLGTRPYARAQEERMSSHRTHVPAPAEINYHEAEQAQRVERALKQIDVASPKNWRNFLR